MSGHHGDNAKPLRPVPPGRWCGLGLFRALHQIEETAAGRGETAGVDIEGREVGVEVNMQRLAPGGARPVGGSSHDGCTDSSPTNLFSNHHVLDPGVYEAVPNDIGEADQSAINSSDDPAETVVLDELSPVPLVIAKQAGAERSSVEFVDLVVIKLSSPGDLDVHDWNVPVSLTTEPCR